MPDDHDGMAAELARAEHPTQWTVALFDWFSDELTPMGRYRTEAAAERARVALLERLQREGKRLTDDDVVKLPPSGG